jgi:voltage-gated potassium channel
MAQSSSNFSPHEESTLKPVRGRFGHTILDDLLMVLLALISIFLLLFEVVHDQTPEQTEVLHWADLTIAFIFLLEWTIRFIKAPDRRQFARLHWWELLASIPLSLDSIQALRSLQLLRVLRLIRLIRFAVRLKVLLDASQRFTEQTYLVYIMTVTGLIIIGGALAFHYCEFGVNPNVKSFWDSFWWATVTTTTIGYGDIYPVTVAGRLIAILVMFTGIGTLGVFTATIAAYIIKQK